MITRNGYRWTFAVRMLNSLRSSGYLYQVRDYYKFMYIIFELKENKLIQNNKRVPFR